VTIITAGGYASRGTKALFVTQVTFAVDETVGTLWGRCR
jgi:hypothetical protein